MKKVTGVVVAFNEAEKIAVALRSLQSVCDEVLVVDSFSSDSTPEICRSLGVQFVQEGWRGYRGQKQFATDLARHDWVLSLDADEKLSESLQDEIRRWKQAADDGNSGFRIPRLTWFAGRWIRHTTWYPDRQLRLFLRTAGAWSGGRVHESVQVKGRVADLHGHIYHLTYASLSEYLQQLDKFSTLAALDNLEAGRRVGGFQLGLYPPLMFLKNFVLRAGFMDGMPGLLVSFLAAVSAFFKYAKLWEARNLQGNCKAADWEGRD